MDLKFTAILLFIFDGAIYTTASVNQCRSIANDSKKTCIRDYKLDVLLMFDQSDSLRRTNFKEVHIALKAWVESYLDVEGVVEETQFAVMGCCDKDTSSPKIFHNFSDRNYKTKVPYWIDNIGYAGKQDNLHRCSDLAAEKVFNKDYGHRENVTNIVLWISDCFHLFHPLISALMKEQHRNASIELQVNKKVEFFFVCCLVTDSKYDYNVTDNWKNIEDWLSVNNRSNDSVILYQNSQQKLADAIDKVIPLKVVDVIDCQIINWTTNCEYDNSTGDCKSQHFYRIVQNPYPTINPEGKVGKQCPSLSLNGTYETCDCWKQTTTSSKKEETSIVWIAIGVIAGLLVLIALLILLMIVRRHKRKPTTISSRDEKEKLDKHKGVGVDLTNMNEMANKLPLSKIEKVDKSMAAKYTRDTFTKSKTGSKSVKMLQKKIK